MRNIYMIIGLLILQVFGTACDDKKDVLPRVLPSLEGDFTDVRDGSTYHWVRYGNLEWMLENIRIKTDAGKSQIYTEIKITDEEREEQMLKNCQKYGYLYDYEAATVAVPEGWRIPSDEDWRNLEEMMGMSKTEVVEFGWRGQQAGEMLQQRECVWLRLGGFINYVMRNETIDENNYTPDFIGFYGFFWSSTKDKSKEDAIIYRQIRYNSSSIGRFSTLRKKMLSLRCVRDVSK